jgi:hypothetical protein
MSRKKECVVCIVDCSEGMGQRLTQPLSDCSTPTRLDLAKQCVEFIIANKSIDNQKNAEVGVIAYGTNETNNQLDELGEDYEHISEVCVIDNPSVDALRRVHALEHTDLQGDFVSGR